MYGHIQSHSTAVSTSRQKSPKPPKPQSLIVCLDENEIPKVQFNPPVYQIANAFTANRCLSILESYPNWHTGHVGFDTETTVYRRHNPQVVSMIQIATRELCFLFQVYKITNGSADKFPHLLKRILTNQDIKKVGVNASGDAGWIKKSYGFEMQGVIDLERIAQEKGYAARSLAELTRMFGDAGLVLEKTKKILKWNFDAAKLDSEIIRYTSSDAFAGIQVYENLLIDRMNDVYLNYEKLHSLSVREEDNEIYLLLLEGHQKGKDLGIKTVINFIENRYQRWITTKPKTDVRREAVLGVIDRLVEDGRLIKVIDDSSDSNSDEQTEKGNFPTDYDFKIRLPGVSIDTMLKVYGKKFFELKGLSLQDSEFMVEISSYCWKAIKKDSLAKIIVNNGKITSLNRKNREVVMNKLNELNRKGALMSGEKWNTLLLHPDWLKELEDGYEEFKLTYVEDKPLKVDDLNDKSPERNASADQNFEPEGNASAGSCQNKQTFEPWKDVSEFNSVWGD
ncbi:7667_t:CDS:2 [Funneliformis geosporum]|uniref:3'-5' exonuclease n=1 Tax=Funneliformis geosporum TaxID=1117311 RepID=A0A9W4SVP0_9GLOM|nr:7667_t:CDS:2 [Funneliformis geosporum]CAI2182357.1 7993_t:CDS:2 [Funneliformis geosporum]